MKNEYNQTPKSIALDLLTLANKLKKNQTKNIIINNSYLNGLNKPISSSFKLSAPPLANTSSSVATLLPHEVKGRSASVISEAREVVDLTLRRISGGNFKASTDAINYYNNKIILENSKFLNKTVTNLNNSTNTVNHTNAKQWGEHSHEVTLALASGVFVKTSLENLDLVNLNTKVDLTNFSFNKKIVLNSVEKENFSQILNDLSKLANQFKFSNDPLANLDSKKILNLTLKKNILSYLKSVGNTSLEPKKKNITLYKYLNYFTKSNNIINTNPNLSKKYGLLLKYNRNIGYNFLNKIKGNKNINLISEYKEEIYKLLFYFFKSIYCLISKPTILFSPDKITIRLFYYLMIPKRKIFNLFSIHHNKEFKTEWYNRKLNLFNHKNKRKKRLSDFKKVENIFNLNMHSNDKNTKFKFNRNININPNNIRLPFMKFKVRKAVSRLKSKPALIKKVYFNLIKFNLVKVFHNKFLVITNILSKLFNKPVTLEITRIHNFKFDTNILANAIQLVMKNKTKNPKLAISNVYKKKNIKILNDPNLISKNNIISFLSGLNIYINGRIMREPIIPRITTKKYEKGATATGKVNYVDTSFITKKNRKGAYTIKVKAAQNFF